MKRKVERESILLTESNSLKKSLKSIVNEIFILKCFLSSLILKEIVGKILKVL